MNELRDQIAQAIFEEPGAGLDWSAVSDSRREPWRMDADRVLEVIRLPTLDEYRNNLVEECIRAVAGVMRIDPEGAGGPIFDAIRAIVGEPTK